MQCCQLGFKLVKSFSFFLEFKILFELRFKTFSQKKIPKSIEEKIMEITLTATKIGYFAQFWIFDDISGSRQSQTNLLIH